MNQGQLVGADFDGMSFTNYNDDPPEVFRMILPATVKSSTNYRNAVYLRTNSIDSYARTIYMFAGYE